MAKRENIIRAYERAVEQLFSNKASFADYLDFSGRFYKLPSSQTIMIYDDNPNAKMVADYDTWQQFGRRVKPGGWSTDVLENGKIKRLFDISMTKGEKVPYQWSLDKNTAEKFVDLLSKTENRSFTGMSDCIYHLAADAVEERLEAVKNSLDIFENDEDVFGRSFASMVRRVVAARCEWNSDFTYGGTGAAKGVDLSALDFLDNSGDMETLLEEVQITAKNVLKSMEKSINDIIFERRIGNERNERIDRARNENVGRGSAPSVVRGGESVSAVGNDAAREAVQARREDVLVQPDDGAAADGRGTGADGEPDKSLGQSVADVYGGELSGGYSEAARQNVVGADTAQDRPGSVGNYGENAGGISSNEPAPDDRERTRLGGAAAVVDERADNGKLGERSEDGTVTSENKIAAEEKSSAGSFSEQVDKALSNELSKYDALKVCDTPQIFIDIGCRQLPMLYTQQHLRDALKPKSKSNSHRHGLTVEQIKSIPDLLAKPAIIFDSIAPGKSGGNSIVAVLNAFDNDNAPIIVSIVPNGRGQYQLETIDSNFITSIYGKDRSFGEFINRAAEANKILFWDKEKSQELFKFQGLQLPEAFNNLDSDIIIHQSRNIVNPFSEKNSQKEDKKQAAEIEKTNENEAEQLRLFPEPLTKKQQAELERLTAELTDEFARWEKQFLDGGSDAFYEDGVGLELIRNHILHYKYELEEKFPNDLPEIYHKETPPEYPRTYQSVKKGDTLRFEYGDYLVLNIEKTNVYSGEYTVLLQDQNGEVITQNLREIKTKFQNLTNRGEVQSRAENIQNEADITYIPSDLDKFYVNRENERVTRVYYNPDSDAGGQLVYEHFTFDQIFDAMIKEDALEYLTEVCRQELADVTAPDFAAKAREFFADTEDFNSRDEGYLDKLGALAEPTFSIMQLKDGENQRDFRFEGMVELRERGLYIDRENYRRVYRGRLKDGETLEDIYTRFNVDRPKDFYGHSLSVGDIIGIVRDGKPAAYYVDSAGFEEVPDFLLDLEERRARRTLTDNIVLYAENQLASDEMDDLGDYLFDPDCTYNHSGLTIGDANFPFDELRKLAERYKNGEDIRAELGRGIYAPRGEISYYGKYGYDFPNPKITVTRDENGMNFKTKGGFEITYSWEQLGEAMITAARNEYERHETLDRATELTDIIEEVRKGKTAAITEKAEEQGVIVENARKKTFGNITLKFDNDRGFHLTADTENERGAVITVFGQNVQAVGEYLERNAERINLTEPIVDRSEKKMTTDEFMADFVPYNEKKLITAERVGDFYEFYGDIAEELSEKFNLTLTQRNGKPMVGIPAYSFEDFCDEIFDKGYMVENDPAYQEIVKPHVTVSPSRARAEELINEYCERELDSEGDFRNPIRVGLAYTDDEKTGLPIEVYADLEYFRIMTEFNHILVSEEKYKSLDEMCDMALNFLNFDDLVYLTEEQRIKGISRTFDELKVGDTVRGDGEIWTITKITGDFSINYKNIDPAAQTTEQSVYGGWKELFAKRGFVRVSSERGSKRFTVEQTSDAFEEPFIIRNNDVSEDSPDRYYDIDGTYQTFETESEAQEYADKLNSTAEPTLESVSPVTQFFGDVISDFREKTDEYYNKLAGYSAHKVEELVKYFIRAAIRENELSAEVGEVVLYGSRCRGMENENSDLDFVAEMYSDLKEDALFNILHETPFEIGGVTVDINPIRAEESGSLEDYLIGAERYLQQKGAKENNAPEVQDYRVEEIEQTSFGQKSRYAANVAAIRALNQIESENRTATPDEQKILAQYVGWGGIPSVFDSDNTSWAAEYAELKELLTPDEYEAARSTVLTAHYTSPTVISAIYSALDKFGFKGGNVLEPSMGIGNFFGVMPDEMRSQSRLHGVELDDISGRIAKQLYPNADIQICGYENTAFSDNFFDAAVGNVPFGNYPVADTRYDREHFLIHDYFFAKTLDKVAPGGVVAFITSKGTLDKATPKVREYLAKRADLIGAIRLPNNAFKANAGTEVTADIIFLQKREKMSVEKPDWCYTAEIVDGIPVNQYFVDHPEMILGKMQLVSGRYGFETACVPIEGANLKEQLDGAVMRLRRDIITARREDKRNEEHGIIPATADVRNFTFTEVNDKIYFRENNIMREIPFSKRNHERMRGMIGIRNTFRALVDAQSEGCSDETLSGLQFRLNAEYDAFVINWGHISDIENRKLFAVDDDYNTLCGALELIDPETKTVTKADIFTKRTIKPYVEVTHVDTSQEALFVSLDMRGYANIGYMAELCGTPNEEVIKELTEGGFIYKNPETEKYEEAAEYLSGYVREKLRKAQDAAAENPEYERNVAALEKALPPKLGAGDISVRLGASWISISDYCDFFREYAQGVISEGSYYARDTVLYRSVSGEYKIENKNADKSVAAQSSFGTKRMNSYAIFENLLNNRDIAVYDSFETPDGKKKRVMNKDETQLAQEKARQIKEAFPKWLWSDPERREKYVEIYNELFNSLVGREYDGSHQTFPGMNPFIELNEHQKNAVMRCKLGGNTLLAHCVGAGKTFEMAAAVMEKRRLGLINKACIIVPKHLVGQMSAEWLRLYPEARLFTAKENDFNDINRQKFIGRCCTGDYDAVIMSYQQFQKIPMSIEYQQEFLTEQLNSLTEQLHDFSNQYLSSNDKRSVKDLERMKKNVEAKLKKLLDTPHDNSLNFEQLGFDCIVTDEAHNYKNGLVVTKMKNVSGIGSKAAKKSEDFLMKTRYLNEKFGERNLILASGTPVASMY